MQLVYRYLFPGMWLAWAAYWWVLFRNVKATARHEPIGSMLLLHIIPLMLAVLLIWLPSGSILVLGERFLLSAAWIIWSGAALTAAGLLFTVWERVHIGTNWSGTVTIKQGHELVTTEPYALVRHPIYTGLLLAFIGSTMARGEWRGVLAVLIAFVALWRKLRFEEKWMRGQFGEAYDAYAKRAPPCLAAFPMPAKCSDSAETASTASRNFTRTVVRRRWPRFLARSPI